MKLKMTQINGNTYCVHGLEESAFFKCLYYQSNLQIQYNPYQNTCGIFHRTRTNNPKIYMEPQKTQNCQSNPVEKEQSWRHNPPRLQTVLQSYSNQNSMVLAQKQIHRSMEQNREPRNKPTLTWSVMTKEAKIYTE